MTSMNRIISQVKRLMPLSKLGRARAARRSRRRADRKRSLAPVRTMMPVA